MNAFEQLTLPQKPGEPLRWRHLTPEERRYISNGCGPKGGWVPVPDWIFEASCDIHDFQYWLGCREEDRLRADLQFYRAMYRDTIRKPRWRRWWYRWLAWLYYHGVRLWGRPSFYYGPKERGREELNAELAKIRDAD